MGQEEKHLKLLKDFIKTKNKEE